jgi:hypothetical protein
MLSVAELCLSVTGHTHGPPQAEDLVFEERLSGFP